ncbi:hypothetical protein F2P81_013686 [Scophthalmus maximus]|uniref:Uncharacterized protein n=1 Tax=Scophthalmus maximus TaxID=52904 RepID=A0A6A4SNX9_SCOMX|nr:hypothetical protein F2P81_013686 [Scophthalmus maximus]
MRGPMLSRLLSESFYRIQGSLQYRSLFSNDDVLHLKPHDTKRRPRSPVGSRSCEASDYHGFLALLCNLPVLATVVSFGMHSPTQMMSDEGRLCEEGR